MSDHLLLELDSLTGGYGDVTVVRDANLTVPAGQTICVTGRNGVGKSTLVKLIAGQLPVLSGTIRFNDADITALHDHNRQSLGIGYAPQESVVF
ncbi:MAG: ATP-binding cassette domain-containing protein, partial [Pseudomonadota bacterium]